jgi:diguanylate cyclase (GGDEF)-like protein
MYRKDNLTKLFGRDYLYANYDDVIKNSTNTILIDFKNLKHINDNHGHMMGDDILREFASKLLTQFPNDISIRLGGDEFLVITKLKEELILEKLELISKEMKRFFSNKVKLEPAPFNSGIVKTMPSFDMTYYRADLAMYHAKERNELYAFFKQEMLDKKEYESELVCKIKTFIKEGVFQYLEREIRPDLIDLTLLDSNYSMVFTKEKSEILRKNNLIQLIDFVNSSFILNNIADNEKTYMINVYHKTLMDDKYIDFIDNIISENNLIKEKICINVNTYGYNADSETIVNKINKLKSIGVKVSIGNVNLENQQYVLPILAFCKLDYIKADKDMFYVATENEEANIVISGVLEILRKKNVEPILINIEEKDYNHEFIKKNNILIRKKIKRV